MAADLLPVAATASKRLLYVTKRYSGGGTRLLT